MQQPPARDARERHGLILELPHAPGEAAPARASASLATDPVPAPDARRPGALQMIEEVGDLAAGLGILLLPLLATALPGVLLFFVLPGVLLAAVAAVLGALFAAIALPPYLLVRTVRRRRRRRDG